ncbi:MAG: hypothetical protein DSY80_09510 [Desulfocapsa sp.]|nr:MAG: hypothetical protein DSY80_09510 [Desulfocapsa sp.]
MYKYIIVIALLTGVVSCGESPPSASNMEAEGDSSVTPSDVAEAEPKPEAEPEAEEYSANYSVPFFSESKISNHFGGTGFGNVYELENGQYWEQASFEISVRVETLPHVLVWSQEAGFKMAIAGERDFINVKPISDISNATSKWSVKDVVITNDYRGYRSGAVFDTAIHGSWTQTSPEYAYRYDYRPKGVVHCYDRGDCRLWVRGMRGSVSVQSD